MGKSAALALMVLTLLLAACTSGDDTTDASSRGNGAGSTTAPVASGPAPGVTDRAIKIGITYVDVKSLLAVGLKYDAGDFKGVYQALIDDINEHGGIHGRRLEPVFVAVNPNVPAAADAACLKLTEDENVFVVTGFWLAGAVACPVGVHETAVVGGTMTPELLAQAKAPWVSPDPDTDQPTAILRALDKRGELDGTIGVYVGHSSDKPVMDNQVLPTLKKLGVKVAESGVVAAPPQDQAAVANETGIIAERFKSAGVDTVIAVGQSGLNWPANRAEDTSYRPKLLFLDPAAPHLFATNPNTTDTSVLDGSLTGGPYGPEQARFDEPQMQACNKIVAAAGIKVLSPDESGGDPTVQPYQSLFLPCPDMALLHALLEAAGRRLNYGTLESAMDGLKVAIPGDPEPRTYGPPPDADGNPTAYLYAWNEKAKDNLPVTG